MITLDVRIGSRLFDDVRVGFDYLNTALDRGLTDNGPALSSHVLKALRKVHLEMVRQHSGPWNGRVVNNTANLQSRSGAGLAAIAKSIKNFTATRVTLASGSITTGGMSIHETGGVVRPKRAQYLTIPLPPAMDSRGVPLRKRARDWDNTFVARSKRGNLLIFRKSARSVVPLYLLKSEIYIRPRLRMAEAMDGSALPYFERKAFETISDALDRAIP
jgi:hypothetical protein